MKLTEHVLASSILSLAYTDYKVTHGLYGLKHALINIPMARSEVKLNFDNEQLFNTLRIIKAEHHTGDIYVEVKFTCGTVCSLANINTLLKAKEKEHVSRR